jgi:hypothetical protein
MKRTPLRRVSLKRQRENVIYKNLRHEHLSANPECVSCSQPATDIHHWLPRGRGGKLNDPTNFLAVCRTCHIKIHDNPLWAEQNNLLKK